MHITLGCTLRGMPQAMKLIDKKFLRRRAGFLRLPNASGTVGPMMRRPPPLSGRASLPGVGPSGSGAATAPFAVADPMDAVRREIAIMKKLDHPNVIRLYEVLDSEESPSLFMGTCAPRRGSLCCRGELTQARKRLVRPRWILRSTVMELAVNGPVMKLHATEPVPPLPLPQALSNFRQLVLGLEYRMYRLLQRLFSAYAVLTRRCCERPLCVGCTRSARPGHRPPRPQARELAGQQRWAAAHHRLWRLGDIQPGVRPHRQEGRQPCVHGARDLSFVQYVPRTVDRPVFRLTPRAHRTH